MLIHLKPTIYACAVPCTLVDLTCSEFGLSLTGGKELAARRPFPNKDYLVACQKIGRKAINGFYVETPEFVREFNLVTRWAVAASHLVTHKVKYIITDDEFDTASEEMTLWELPSSWGDFKSRYPIGRSYGSPMESQPRMDLFGERERVGEIKDTLNGHGALIERSEVFYLPTIERDRLRFSLFRDRMPAIESAFRALSTEAHAC
ncbi:TPA: DUF6012 family protein [Pseudomonas aeruginosa]|uniref:DUF6012 family protein n=1 Tax=Pseudomonas aeruginosa TaxID=287 RepID=UPI001F4B7F67|nr:DUF6012 family protein [Pseudomonas aeruginosa]